jgi:phosphoenolpyruvate carboxykinase (GTP)
LIDAREGRRSGDALGNRPRYDDLNWQGLDFPKARFDHVMSLEGSTWNKELAAHDELFTAIGDKLPDALRAKSAYG